MNLRFYNNTNIGPYPITEIQNVLVHNEAGLLNKKIIMKLLACDDQYAGDLLEFLKTEGWIEQLKDTLVWKNTVKGYYLTQVAISRTIDRKKAEIIVNDVLERITFINTCDTFLHKVETAFVYGDYLSPVEDVKKIDIVIKITKKPMPAYLYKEKVSKLRSTPNLRVNNLTNRLYINEFLIINFIKNGTHNLNIHDINNDSFNTDQKVMRQIFPSNL